jgi:hypothetical protein
MIERPQADLLAVMSKRARYDRPHVDHRRKPFFGLRDGR